MSKAEARRSDSMSKASRGEANRGEAGSKQLEARKW
jgi:hypothetical protein